MAAFTHPPLVTPTTGYVLFSGAPPAPEDLLGVLREGFGDQVSLTELPVRSGDQVGTAVVRLGPLTALVAPVEGPLNPDLVRRTAHPAWWGQSGEDPVRHGSHVIISVMRGVTHTDARAQGFEEAGLWSAVAARVAQLDGATAVLAVTAAVSVPASRYVELVTSGRATQEMPVDLWVSVWALRNEDGTVTVFTHGLDGFGHADLVVNNSTEEPGSLIRLLGGVARMVVVQGARLVPGESVSTSPLEQRAVKAVTSPRHSNKVLEIGPPLPMAV